MLLPGLPRQYLKPGLKLKFANDHGCVVELRNGMIVTKWGYYGTVIDYPASFSCTFVFPKQVIVNNKVII